MTPEQKDLLRDTWRAVTPIADDAAKLFYDRLFETDPGTRPLFARAVMPEQRAKLMAAIGQVIDGLDELDRIVPTIEALGRRHAGYDVTDAHYNSVGAALLWTLEQGLGDAWDTGRRRCLDGRLHAHRRHNAPRRGRKHGCRLSRRPPGSAHPVSSLNRDVCR